MQLIGEEVAMNAARNAARMRSFSDSVTLEIILNC